MSARFAIEKFNLRSILYAIAQIITRPEENIISYFLYVDYFPIFCILICSLYLIHSKSFLFTENFAYFGSRYTIQTLEKYAQTINHTMMNLMQKSLRTIPKK